MSVFSTPKRRDINSYFASKDFGGPEPLWHGTGCVCDHCVAHGYACWCRNPHCEAASHEGVIPIFDGRATR